jgi:hypothetical protein
MTGTSRLQHTSLALGADKSSGKRRRSGRRQLGVAEKWNAGVGRVSTSTIGADKSFQVEESGSEKEPFDRRKSISYHVNLCYLEDEDREIGDISCCFRMKNR